MIRRATPADIEAIARVHVQAWRESYSNLVPPEALDERSVETRVAQWRGALADPDRTTFVHESDGAVSGFASGGSIKWTGLLTDGEVSSLYLLDKIKRRGVGRALFGQLIAALAERGFKSCGLWVLIGNVPAQRFYEAMGGHAGETRTDRRNNLVLDEVSYIWNDLRADRT